MPLPQGVIFQPVLAPAVAIDTNSFSLLLQNETRREVVIPQDTFLGKVQAANLARDLLKGEGFVEMDPSLIDLDDSPIPTE